MHIISTWMAKVIETCAVHGESTSVSNTWLIGHSLGAQFSGETAKRLQESGSKVHKVIGLDPAGVLFQNDYQNGKCHGIQRDHAEQTMIFITNPGILGVNSPDLASVSVECNKHNGFCQDGCNCLSMTCNHFYASKELFAALVEGKTLKGKCVTQSGSRSASISIYDQMEPGKYEMNAADNPHMLQKSTEKGHDEL